MGTDATKSGSGDTEPDVVISALNLRRRGPEPLLRTEPDTEFDLPPVGRPPRPFPWRRLGRLATALLAVGIVAAGIFTWWDRTTIHRGGPVDIGGGGSGLPLDVDEPTSFGAIILTNRGKTPAVLEKIRVLGSTDGFEVLGVRTNHFPLSANVGFFSGALGFPPNGYPSDSLADRHVVPAAKRGTAEDNSEVGLQLVVGARAKWIGVARAWGVEVTYRVGPRRFRRTSGASMQICAPKDRYRFEDCPMDDEFDDTAVEFHVPNQ